MGAIAFNHVSIHADDLEESAQFYEEVFDMERIPSPNFDVDVVWLRCGDAQLHLFDRDVDAPASHHFAVTVDDFEAVYEEIERRGLFDHDGDTSDEPQRMYALADGAVQLYVRDPAHNLIEVDWPDVETLEESIRDAIVDRADQNPQTGEAEDATLFMDD
ncbi:VOC family protein [Halobacteria archaeon AArc-m2/3/4]|uniref:VOC family protein n=1 Tax=Natronoglomus mannanivorans TaxID=2979990 RepID=A0ABT2QIY5_9EURY|nr:VOC family protein [Halobacteria archaeon AArc-m2/3/4]